MQVVEDRRAEPTTTAQGYEIALKPGSRWGKDSEKFCVKIQDANT